MPTKEEIALKYVSCRCDEAYTSRNLTAPDCPYHSTDPESAMDEFAEQQSIAFAEWLTREGGHYAPLYGNTERWCDNEREYTTYELYQLYKQQDK